MSVVLETDKLQRPIIPSTNVNADIEVVVAVDKQQDHMNNEDVPAMMKLATENLISLQEHGDTSYLLTGGGFCDFDDENDREEGCKLVEMAPENDQGDRCDFIQMMPEKDQEERYGLLKMMPENNAKNTGQIDVFDGEVRDPYAYANDSFPNDGNLKEPSIRREPRFRAVPALKRKKLRSK